LGKEGKDMGWTDPSTADLTQVASLSALSADLGSDTKCAFPSSHLPVPYPIRERPFHQAVERATRDTSALLAKAK